MKPEGVTVVCLIAALSGPAGALASQLPSPERISAQAESYVNLQLCSNTYLEYRDQAKEAQRFLDASLDIQRGYTTDEELRAFVGAIQQAHEKQSDIEVHEYETREQFYLRVFSEARCQEELKTASRWANTGHRTSSASKQ